MKINSKRQFFALWEAGVLGNRTRLWRTTDDAWKWVRQQPHSASSPHPMLGFRELRKPGTAGAGKWELVPWFKMFETEERWRAEGRDFVIDDGCPNERTTLCGEVSRTFLGLTGSLAIEPRCGMRVAMDRQLLAHRTPTVVRALLERYMDPSSQADLDALLELYPDAAVEFSCFSCNVGVLPHRNTLFWEVRNY